MDSKKIAVVEGNDVEKHIKKIADDLGIKKPRIVSDVTNPIPHDLEIDQKHSAKSGITLKRKYKKVHGNDPCTCGSGKKAKKCCYSPYSR